MKKILLFIALIIMVSGVATAQKTDERLKPTAGDWGFLINVDGLIDQIQFSSLKSPIQSSLLSVKYYKTNDLALRFDIGPKFISNTTKRADSIASNYFERDSTFSNFSLYLAGGVEKHFTTSKRLDPYLGASLGLGFIGKTKITEEERLIQPNGTEKTTVEYKRDGGFALGVFGTAGFNYFLAKNFALGAEYSVGYSFIKNGGNFSEITQIDPINGSNSTTVIKGKSQTNQNDFSVEGNTRILISYYF